MKSRWQLVALAACAALAALYLAASPQTVNVQPSIATAVTDSETSGPFPRPVPTAATFEAAVQEAATLDRLHSLLISHRGQLLVERYYNGATRTRLANMKSASKSVISALVGIAIHQGHIEG